MFGFLRKKQPKRVFPYSWHYSQSENKMVPCDSTPCRLHGDSDVLGCNEDEATAHYNERIRARQEREAREKEKRIRAHNAANTASTANTNVNNDPDSLKDEDYFDTTLFHDNGHAALISCNPMTMGNNRYVPVLHEWDDVNSAVEFAHECNTCKGEGKVERNNNRGRKKKCPDCSGSGFIRHISGSPAEMALLQPVKDPADKVFHAFVKAHPDEFNDYMIHSMFAGCYLADEGEEKVYARDYTSNPKWVIAADPDGAYQMMIRKAADYKAAMQACVNPVKREYGTNRGELHGFTGSLPPTVVIKRVSYYTDKKTGERRVVAIGLSDKNSFIKFFAKYDPKIKFLARAVVQGAYRGCDYEPDGRILQKLDAADVNVLEPRYSTWDRKTFW